MMEVTLEVWVCASCGFAESYARDLDILEHLESCDAANVRRVDNSADGSGPFR
jgi:hypothetical protein